MRESSSLEYDIKTNYENEKIYLLPNIYPSEPLWCFVFCRRTRRGFTPLWVEAQPKEGLNQR